MQPWKRSFLALALLGASAQGDNPEYGWWSTFAPGSWVKVRVEGEVEGRPFTLDQTQTLVEVDADRVVIRRKGTMRVEGQDLPASKDRDEILRKHEPVLKIEREGDEEIGLPTGKALCHWIEGRDPHTNATVKFWLAKKVPGSVVKGEIRDEGATGATRITVLSWEAK
jgi:hypothetical protein